MYRTLGSITVATAISVAALAMPGWATAAPPAATSQPAETPPMEMYAVELPFAGIVDAARSWLTKNGTVVISEEHVIAGEDNTSHYRYLIVVTPAKSSPNKSYLTIEVSTGETPPPHGAAAPRDELHAFIRQLGGKLGVAPQFVRAAK
ncbi:hypothetical protein BLA9940_04533 [Burkholderia aenigmatica]|uniref:Uncharacterized protein n=1 Tax=Burkholderia aenigmatica TaxID=2015348 RepID=A0A6J5JCC0_9BURK|nr:MULTISPECIES: hypothetical protein [Burkholderia]UKD10449.1 hypothetical protein L3V59_12215 [Burkholderia aenigmatica]CAB3969025.1 hypothetical protein BLA3211_05255 [Burkholderia aenigmatica]VWC77317.1 hypothetical protein BLA9940_04533 [Burkholderia aenigmatica]